MGNSSSASEAQAVYQPVPDEHYGLWDNKKRVCSGIRDKIQDR